MARISKEWVDAYFAHGVDVANRRVFLFEGVEEDSIGTVVKGLYFMDSQNKEKKEKIELFVGSFGGSEYEMFALYDVIQTLKSPIHTVAMGKCMSAAPLLVAAGCPGERWATPNTWFMVHQGWDEFGEKRYDDLQRDITHMKEMGKVWYALMEKHTKKNAAFWKRLCDKSGDTYFDAQQALEWGIVDSLWDEKSGD